MNGEPETLQRLPQTGQINWPVPVLAVSGGVLFLSGLILRQQGKKDTAEEECGESDSAEENAGKG